MNCILSVRDLYYCWAELYTVRKKGALKDYCLRKSNRIWPHNAACTITWGVQDSLRLIEKVEGSNIALLWSSGNNYFRQQTGVISPLWRGTENQLLSLGLTWDHSKRRPVQMRGASACVSATTQGVLQKELESFPLCGSSRDFSLISLGSARHPSCARWARRSSQRHNAGVPTLHFSWQESPLLNSPPWHQFVASSNLVILLVLLIQYLILTNVLSFFLFKNTYNLIKKTVYQCPKPPSSFVLLKYIISLPEKFYSNFPFLGNCLINSPKIAPLWYWFPSALCNKAKAMSVF